MDRFDTIVIGAGMTGVCVAKLLTQAGRHVVVLEARGRIGGRMHTERADGHITDVGASWIHGINDSPVYAAAQAFGMRTIEFTVGGYQPDSRPIAHYAPDGTRLSDDAAAAYVGDIHAIDAKLVDVLADCAPDATYFDVTEAAIAAHEWDSERAQRVREYFAHRSEEQYGASITDLAAHGLDDDQVDGDEVVFPDGYDELPRTIAQGLDVRLDTVVERVEWSAYGVTVVTNAGTFAASDVVVTVPTGVLRSPDFVISPPLPDELADALERLPMNAFEKVFLRFDRKFWDDNVYAVRQQGQEGLWWHSWYDLTALHGEPTLLTFAAGDAAREIRQWADGDVAASVMTQLRRLYDDVPDPTSVLVTHWQDDPFTHGSYAYMARGAETHDHDILATPVGGVLHLAGEATWTDDPATVTGAMMSGHRAAEHVLGRDVDIERLWS